MISILVNDTPLYIDKGTSIQMEVNNNSFSTEKIEGDIVYTFDVPAEPNDRIFRHSKYICVNRVKKFSCRILVGGVEIAEGDLYLQKSTLTKYSCGLIVNPFSTGFAEAKLNENDFGPDVVISTDNLTHRNSWKSFLLSTLPNESFIKFPLFLNPSFYGDSNKDFGWYLLPSDNVDGNNPSGFQASLNRNDNICLDRCYINRFFTYHNGNIVDAISSSRGLRIFNNESVDNPNSFAFCPALRLIWMLEKVVNSGGYRLTGNFTKHSAIRKIFSQSMNALDGLATQYDSVHAGSHASISPAVSYNNSSTEQFIMSFDDGNDSQHYYFSVPSNGLYLFLVTINTYFPANLLTSGIDPDNPDMEYKEAIVFLIIPKNENLPNWVYGSFNDDWNTGIGTMSAGNYTPFPYYFKIYTPDQLSQFGYVGAGFYSLTYNFSNMLQIGREYRFCFCKAIGYGDDYGITSIFDWQNIPITQDVTTYYNLYNCFANIFNYRDHVPDLSNGEFFSAMCNGFGLSLFIDSRKKEMEFTFFKDILSAYKSIDLSSFLLDENTSIEKTEDKSYVFTLQGISTEDIDETKLLPSVRTSFELPDPVINYGKICFVENENQYLRAERMGDAVLNWIFTWNPYTGNSESLMIGEGNEEPISPALKTPSMIWIEKNAGLHTLIGMIDSKGCIPIFSTQEKRFEMILTNYVGRRSIKIGLYEYYYEAATPSAYNGDGTPNGAMAISAVGQDSVGAAWVKPWLDFLATHEKINCKFLLPLNKFIELWELLKPQETNPTEQVRWIMVNSVRLLPIKMTFQFTQGSENIVTEVECAKENVKL